MRKSTLIAILMIVICAMIGILTTGSCKSKSGMTSRAMKDGRWEAFQECIDKHPSDAVCDSCWTAIIENRDNK